MELSDSLRDHPNDHVLLYELYSLLLHFSRLLNASDKKSSRGSFENLQHLDAFPETSGTHCIAFCTLYRPCQDPSSHNSFLFCWLGTALIEVPTMSRERRLFRPTLSTLHRYIYSTFDLLKPTQTISRPIFLFRFIHNSLYHPLTSVVSLYHAISSTLLSRGMCIGRRLSDAQPPYPLYLLTKPNKKF